MIEHRTLAQGVSRRSFLALGAAAGMAAASSADILRTLTAPGTADAASNTVSFSLNDEPAASDKADLAAYNNVVARFEKVHPTIKVVGKVDTFDPTTFYTHYAVGNVEDTYKVYFTDVQHLIQVGYAQDLTAWMKTWPWLSSIQSSVLQLMSDSAGKIYGFPVDAYALGLAYSKTLFKQVGLDPNAPPTTWDQFRACARTLTSSSSGRYGFGPLSIYNTGGWHLTAMMYSYGGQPEISQNGKLVANLNSPNCVKPLQLLHEMRWVDHSIGPKQYGYNDNTAGLANGSLGMGILAGDQPRFFKSQFQANINDFMLVGLPQGGGNATLMGGDVQLVKPGSSAAVINAALSFTSFRYWDLTSLPVTDQATIAGGGVIGVPANIIVGGALKAAIDKINATYRNVDPANYKLFVQANSTLKLTPEPRVAAQKMYALLDPCVQAILSDSHADPQKLLDDANSKFQAVLDASQS
jgi:ABC-type glycerol-3-phosphate transport system substrate-binding protein